MARKVNYRQQNVPIPVIIGAGKTEQWYFTHLQRIMNYRVKVRPRFFGQEDIFQMAKKIESVIADGGFAIAVFDADVASWDEKERNKLESMRRKYANNPNVILCDSLPSIEYWFLLHFASIHRLLPTSASVIKELVKHLPGFDKTDNYLSQSKWVETLCAYNRMDHALTEATKSQEGQSYTKLPLAIQKLSSQK